MHIKAEYRGKRGLLRSSHKSSFQTDQGNKPWLLGFEPEPAEIKKPILDGSENKYRNLTVTYVCKLMFYLQITFLFPPL